MTSDQREERRELSRTCRRLAGAPYEPPHGELARVARWIEEQGHGHDAYGTGEFLQAFESRVAELLGFEGARFLPSGTMAQQIAMRIHGDRAGLPVIGLHPTSHLELHEQAGYAKLHGLRAVMVGPPERPILSSDLEGVSEPLSALLVELPTRENGGQLPSWDELQDLTRTASERGIRLHLDGARLWEAQASYGRPFPEICAPFDSAYVSFYKGIGALPGSMLLGSFDFLEEAMVWQRRHGGNLYTSLPNAASAAMRLDARLERMPRYLERARQVAAALGSVEGLELVPDPPQVNQFHLHFAAPVERLLAARDQVARDRGLWLFGGASELGEAGGSRVEIAIGEAAFQVTDGECVGGFRALMENLRAEKRGAGARG